MTQLNEPRGVFGGAMRRREFIPLIGGAAVALPRVVFAVVFFNMSNAFRLFDYLQNS
jgi:hypothetical protein